MKKNTSNVLTVIAQNVHTPEEFDAFFTDLLTPKEYEDFLIRVQICQKLAAGATVLQVCKSLNVASATVVRGNRILKHGSRFVRNLFHI